MYCTKFAKRTLAIMVACAIAAPALAADEPPVINSFVDALENGKPMTNFRLRYEHVDDANPAHTDNADAWTLRSLIGWQTAPFHDFSVAVQLINVTQLNDQFYDGSNGVFGSSSAIPLDKRKYPVVGDPDYTNVNQAYIEWTGLKGTAVRLGRQSVKLDNVRFIGNVEFRQVMQVFDGIAVENKGLLPDTSIYLAHFGGLQQTSTKYRSANVEIANVKYNFSPTESIGGYGYFIDWNHKTDVTNANPYNEDNSNRTLGLRLDGAHGINDDWKVLYTAEYAKQDDYKDGLSKIDAHYLKFGGGAQYQSWYARIDHEVLSSNRGRDGSLYAFQTPLGTNHLFQGWADLLVVTPNEGIKDTFLSFGGKVQGIQLLGEYHWIKSDKDFTTPAGPGTGDRYGKELNLSVAYTWNKWMGKLEYADFQEDDKYNAARKFDTEKIWATVMYTF